MICDFLLCSPDVVMSTPILQFGGVIARLDYGVAPSLTTKPQRQTIG